MKKKTTPTTKLIAGALLVLFQATVNSGSVQACFSAECIGYNAVGLGLWALGIWFVYVGVRDLRRGRARDTQA